MNAEDILVNLIEEVRLIVEPNDPEGMHKANCPFGEDCTACHMMRVIRPMLEEAEAALERLKLGIGQ